MSREQKKFCCGVCQLNYELANGIVFGEKPKQAPITLTLTREQAGDIRLCLDTVLDYDHFLALEELKQKIEEKLR